MGYFSWKDCIDKKSIKIGSECYLLIPEAFGSGHYHTLSYDGYGNFGGVDVYEVVAEWNRDTLSATMLEEKPRLEQYGGLYGFKIEDLKNKGLSDEEIRDIEDQKRQKAYNSGLSRWNYSLERLTDYKNGLSDSDMEDKYGEDFKREIGIDIACYEEQNKKLKYPIKITKDASAIYENCKYSKDDPSQGCY